MQTPKILLATAIFATLTACGGAGSDTLPTDKDLAVQNQPLPAAPKVPLTAEEQAAFAAKKVFSIESDYGVSRLIVNGQTVAESDGKTDKRDFRSLPAGFVTLPSTYTEPGNSMRTIYRSLQGFRSGVAINYKAKNHRMESYDIYGVKLPASKLPTRGKARYSGIIFDHGERGTFTYEIDFNAQTGEGKIEGLNPAYGTIRLRQADFAGNNENRSLINGDASAAQGQSMGYSIWLAGQGAEEVVGFLRDSSDEPLAGFLGERDAISQ